MTNRLFPDSTNMDILNLEGSTFVLAEWVEPDLHVHVRFRNTFVFKIFGMATKIDSALDFSAGQIQIRCIMFSIVTYATDHLSHVSQSHV